MKGVVILIFLMTCVLFGETTNLTDETRLTQTLLQNYDPQARPVIVTSDQVNVSLSLHIIKLHEIDTKLQHLSVIGFLKVEWTDYRLTWNPADYGGLDYVAYNPSKLWMPSFVLANSASGTMYNHEWYSLFKVRVYSDGTLKWTPGGKLESYCHIDVSVFPFDEQICEFVFENWVYTGNKVNLTFLPDAADTFLDQYIVKNGEWDVLEVKVIRQDRYTETGTEAWPEVHFGIKCRRKPLFYVTNIILLSILLAVLVQLMFKLPAESGERISMGVTLLLSFSVFILMIDSSIPDTSTSTPLIIVYLICFMTLTTLGICESVLILYCHHHSGNYRPHRWLRYVVFHLMSKCLCKNTKCTKHKVAPNDKESKNNNNSQSNDEQKNSVVSIRLGGKDTTAIEHDLKNNQNDYEAMLEEPCHDKEANINEWHQMAIIIDKFMFWLFLIMFILLMLILLIIIPYAQAGKDINNTIQWAGF